MATTNASSKILTINGGSSSLKFALFDRANQSARLLSGRVDRIGLKDCRWVVAQEGVGREENCGVDAPDEKTAVHLLIDWLKRAVGFAEIAAVGHRVVHGGSRYQQPEPVTAELIEELRKISPCDPDHLPGEIELIEAFRNQAPDLPQVACSGRPWNRLAEAYWPRLFWGGPAPPNACWSSSCASRRFR